MDRDRFLALALQNPVNAAIVDELSRLELPDAWLDAGCLVQKVWNALTGRAIDHGIADNDIFYFDPETSWESEDAVIRLLQARLAHLRVKVEIRNQARVHLWYPDKHDRPYPPLMRSSDGIDRFLTENTQLGIRPVGGGFEVYAPHGFGDVASLIVRPNRSPNFSLANYVAKAARWKALWPELTVIAAE